MKLDSSFFLSWIGHGKYPIRDDELPQWGVAKVTCPTFEAMGQIPAFHRTYFLLIITLVFLGRFFVLFAPVETGRNTLQKLNKVCHFTLTVSPHYLVKLKPHINSTF